ncbi:MAG TPA: hypothetical protein VLS89_20820 [Candidatus Nanopelagicales bacterium]|nr:hypothetical protein [Candidatus Nanopelagicales bacterium]
MTPIDTRPIEVPPADEGTLPAPRPVPGGASGGATGGAQEKAFDGTTASSERLRPGMKPATLKEVRAAENEGFDRVVVEFAGAGVSGWRARYLEGSARQCGSGDAVKVAGSALLEVTLLPAQAHDEKGQVTIKDRERKPGLPLIQEMKLTCDFEGQVTWVLGLSEKAPYRVLELGSPARVVVDVRR